MKNCRPWFLLAILVLLVPAFSGCSRPSSATPQSKALKLISTIDKVVIPNSAQQLIADLASMDHRISLSENPRTWVASGDLYSIWVRMGSKRERMLFKTLGEIEFKRERSSKRILAAADRDRPASDGEWFFFDEVALEAGTYKVALKNWPRRNYNFVLAPKKYLDQIKKALGEKEIVYLIAPPANAEEP